MTYKNFVCLLIAFFAFCSATLHAQNPPYANVNAAPTQVGSDYEFQVELATIGFLGTDCNGFFVSCLNDLDIFWEVIPVSECSGCPISTTPVASGSIKDVFWSENCVYDGSPNTGDCNDTGGCEQFFYVPEADLCEGITYKVVTYAFNPLYGGGNNGYQCCSASSPATPDLEGMDDACTLFSNGGSGTGWFNPSYPQEFEFTLGGTPPPPILNITANIVDGDVVPCGFELDTDLSATSPGSCVETQYEYKILVNGVAVESNTSECSLTTATIDYTSELIGCPDEPTCIAGVGQFKVQCGVNTIRWEATQICTGATTAFEELSFTLDCAEADALSVSLEDQVLCPEEIGTIEVVNPANVNIPAAGGTYELHWDNADPYAAPNNNYIGSGLSANVTNDGSFPYNTPIEVIGSVWDNYPSGFVDGCQAYSETAEFVMLEPITGAPANEACSYNTMVIEAAGGLPAYDASTYTYDASSAGAGTNTTGVFNTTTTGAPIPTGTYTVIVSDGEGCSAEVEAEVYEPIDLVFGLSSCTDYGSFTATVSGGQPGHPNQSLTNFVLISNLDGLLGSPDATGAFATSTTLSAGVHTITARYNHLGPDGVPTGDVCLQTFEIEIYEPIEIEQELGCEYNQVEVIAMGGYAGSPNTTGTDFSYDLYNGPTATGAIVSSNSSGIFTGLDAGVYTIEVNDNNPDADPANSCTETITVEVYDPLVIDFTSDTCSSNTDLTVNGASGGLDPLDPAFTGGSYTITLSTDGSSSPAPGTTPFTTTDPVADAPFTFSGLGVSTDYYIVLEDERTDPNTGQNCSTVIGPISLSEPPELEAGFGVCTRINRFGVSMLGGTGPFDYYVYDLNAPLEGAPSPYDPTLALAGAALDLNGVPLGLSDEASTGLFVDVPAGTYTVYGVDANGCPESETVAEAYDPFDIQLDEGDCAGINLVDISAVTGGRDPNNTVGGGFSGSAYTIFLSTTSADAGATAPGDVLDLNGAAVPAINENGVDPAVGTPEFEDLPAGSYHVVVEDDRGCQYSVPVTVTDAPELQANSAGCDVYGQASVAATGGTPDWSFYLYPQGAAYQDNGAGSLQSDTGDGTGTDQTGEFTGVSAGTYTVYGVDANDCPASSVDVTVIEEITAEFEYNCDYGSVSVSASGGAAETDNSLTYSYQLLDGSGQAVGAPIMATFAEGSQTFSDLSGGEYSLEVTEGECSIEIPIEVFDPLLVEGSGCVLDSYDATANGGYAGASFVSGVDYSFTLFNDAGVQVSTNSTGSFSDLDPGDYTITIDDNNPNVAVACTEELSFSIYELLLENEVCDFNTVSASIPGYAGQQSYTLTNDDSGENFESNITGVFSEVPAGNYTLSYTTGQGCSATAPVVLFDPIVLEDYSCSEGATVTGGLAPYTYQMTTLSGGLVGSNDTGQFPTLPTGTYNLIVRDANNCTITTEVNCFTCEITATVTSTCAGQTDFELTLDLAGDGTYIVDDGVNPALTGQSSGQIDLGTFPNGAYTITITSEIDDTCIEVIADEKDCFECDLGVQQSTSCEDLFNYAVTLDISGTGTFIVDNGTSQQTGVPSGSFAAGSYPNGSQTFTITSELDATCQEAVTVTDDCFECGLAPTAVSNCLDEFTYEVIVDLIGNGSFSIDDGGGSPSTGANAGQYTFGPYNNNDVYSIEIISEVDPGCSIILSDVENCFDCGLTVSEVVNCIDLETFEVELTFNGSGTFTVDDSVNPAQSGLSSETITLGPYPDGNYAITVQSELEPDCLEIVSGTSECYTCDLTASATTNCLDLQNYEVNLTVGGSSTYTIDDGVHALITGQASGTLNLGSFPNGTYTIVITDEIEGTCLEEVVVNEDCFNCDLNATASIECNDFDSYTVTVNLEGSSSYTIVQGGTVLNGQTAGAIPIGPIPNGPYIIDVTDEISGDCVFNLTGERDCFECDLTATGSPICVDDFNYNVALAIGGSGSYTVNDGVNPPISGVTAGSITVGPIPSGPYAILVVDESDETCSETVTGEQVCFECDLVTSALPFCQDDFEYTVLVTIVGSGTFSLDDGVNPVVTGLSAGQHTVGPLPNGPFSIEVVSEIEPSCTSTEAGDQNCFECDLAANALSTCSDIENFELVIAISGSGTYTVDDQLNPILTGVSAGSIVLGNYPSGSYTVVITSETSADCNFTLTDTVDCFECTLEPSVSTECLDFDQYEVEVSITAPGEYNYDDGLNPPTVVSAGVYTSGPYDNGGYTIDISAVGHPDCAVSLTGEQDCFECDLELLPLVECEGLEEYFVTVTASGSGSYLVEDGLNPTQTLVAGDYVFGPYSNGGYSISFTDSDRPECNRVVSGEQDCFECDLSANAVTNCLDGQRYEVEVTLNGSSSYSIENGIDPTITGVSAGSVTFGPYDNGAYQILITDELSDDCNFTLTGEEDCFECDLDAIATTNCLDTQTYEVEMTLFGSGTYEIQNGIDTPISGATAGTYTFGPYSNGPYQILILDETQEDCQFTVVGEQDCFECDLSATVEVECLEYPQYNLIFELSGSGFYTIDDGNNTILNGAAAGTVVFGPLTSNNYVVTISDELDDTCLETYEGTQDCQECDLITSLEEVCNDDGSYVIQLTIEGSDDYTVTQGDLILTGDAVAGTYEFGPFDIDVESITVSSNLLQGCFDVLDVAPECFVCAEPLATTECFNPQTYLVNLELNGTGTYEVSDGVNPAFVNQTGSVQIGPFFNGPYSITVSSEQEPDCVFVLQGEEDCTVCDLELTQTVTCEEDGLGYLVELQISGTGTYSVDDGSDAILTGVTAGSITIGPIPNGPYAITVASEQDETCSEVASGEEDCFDCDLQVEHAPECSTFEQYLVSVTLSGSGTYTINDGIGSILVNQEPGNIVLGPYLNGVYAFTITSEQDAACSEIINGEFDCFECELNASVSTNCDDFEEYMAVLQFSGQGTYTIDDGEGNIITDAIAGTYNLGPFSNGAYLITVTSTIDETCREVLTGVEDCFECDLDVSEIAECIDFENFLVSVILEGSGTYTISDGLNPPVAGYEAGEYVFGPYSSTTYVISIQSELAADCSATLLGTASCFECDLPSAAATECIDEESYNVLFTLPGPGNYIVDDNQSPPELLEPGNYVWGPVPNGPYNISIVSDQDEECSTTLTGINDCSSDEVCEVSLSGLPVCVDENNFVIELSLTGTGTFTISDANTTLTGQSSGVITLGPYPSGAYNITVTSEDVENCQVPFSGTYFCTPDFVCDLGIVVNTECTTVNSYEAILSLTGTGTYTIDTAGVVILTGQSAGTITIEDIPNGSVSVGITSEIDDECAFTVPVTNDCTDEFTCDLEVLADIVCIEEGVDGFQIILTVSGTATYSITDPTIGFNLEGAIAGEYVLGPYEDGAYNVTVTNEGNPICFQGISGNKACELEVECDLSIGLTVECEGDDVVLVLTIVGSSVYSVFTDVEVLENVTEGVYEIQAGGFVEEFYNVFVQDNQEFNCFENASGARDCPDCDFSTTVTPICDETTDEFYIEVAIEGDITVDISDGFFGGFIVEDVVSPATVLVGPFEDGFYNILVTSQDGICFDQFSGSFECGPPIECDLAVTYELSDCDPATEEFFVIVTIEGSDTYDISYDGFGGFIDDATSGVYELGPFQFDYSIFIDESNGFFFDCNTSIFGQWNCECDFDVSVETECIDEDSYLLYVTIGGEGTFTIDDFTGNILDGVEAGTYTLGPFTEDPFQPFPEPFFYFLDITSDEFPDCIQNLFGNANCLPDPPCELVANVEFECYDDGFTYDMIVTIEGEDTYTIDDGINDVLTGQAAGTYVLGPGTNGAYEIFIQSEDFPDCAQTLAGGQFCEAPPECDLVANIQRECVDDFTFDLSIILSGTGSYTISSDLQPDQTGLGPGTYTISGVPNGAYEVEVFDANNSLCQQSFTGDYDCTPVIPCDLASNVQAVCIDGEPNYNLIVDISGSSLYDIEVDGFAPVQGVGTGVYTFGPIPNGPYNYNITDLNNDDCEQSGLGVNDCPFFPPACDIETSISYECAADGQSYFVIMDIAGASSYSLYEGLYGGGPPFSGDLILSNISEGQYTLGPFPAGGTTLLLVDEANIACFADFVIVRDCSCDLDFVLDLECEDENSYFINLEIQGSSTYEITVNEFGTSNDVVLTNVSAGLETIGPFTFDQFFFTIADEQGDCFQDYLGVRDCSPNNGTCDLDAEIVNVYCDENNSVFIDLQIQGVTTALVQLSNLPGESVGPGITTLGPIPDEFNYSFTVRDLDNGSCIQTFNGNYECEPEVICDLELGLQAPVCNDANDGFFVDITLTGSDTYTIDTGAGVPDIEGVAAGTYTAGPFPSGLYQIQVTSADGSGTCLESTTGTFSCAPPPTCDLGVTIVDIECSGFLFFQFFTITLEITGADNYSIFVDNQLLEDVPAGTYVFEDLTAENAYEIYVQSNSNPECFYASGAPNPCNDEVDCNLNANVDAACSGEDTYTLTVNITGPSSYEVMLDPAGDIINGLTEGVYQFGPYNNSLGTTYQVSILDELDGDCFFDIVGTIECNPDPPSCELDVQVLDISCSGTSFFDLFEVTLLIEGNALYKITTADEVIENVAPGTITLGPYVAEELYQIRVEDNLIADCFQVVEAPNPCSDEVDCDLLVNTAVVCLEEGYNLTVDISGTDTYQVSGSVGGQPFDIVGVSPGVLDLGPFSVEGTYEIVVQSLQDATCSFTNSAFAECPDQPLCDVGLELIEIVCDEIDGENVYTVEVEVSGSDAYELLVDGNSFESGATAGTYVAGPFPATGGTFTIVAEQGEDCFEEVSGTNNCVITGCIPPTANETVVCNENGTFNLIVVFDGAAQYDIVANIVGGQSDQALSQSTGTVELGPFIGGVEDAYEITVSQTSYPQCFVSLTGSTNCPSDPIEFCNLFANADASCINELTYEVDVTITGSGTYNVYSDAGDVFGQTAGIITLGPFTSANYSIYLEKTTDSTCNQTLNGSLQCGDPFQCTLLADVDIECVTDETYQLIVEFSGGGTFRINDGFGNIVTGLSAGTYPFGPFSADNFVVTVQSEFDPTCFQELTGSSPCSDDGACTLQIGTTPTCVDEDTFEVLLSINGNSTYSINSTATGFTELTGQTEGDIVIENFQFGVFDIVVQDEQNPQCFAGQNGNVDCSNPPNCDLNAEFIEHTCIGDSNFYNITIGISGSGTYTVYDGENVLAANVTEGEVEVGPFSSPPYSVLVSSDVLGDCSQTLNGFIICETDPDECPLSTSAIVTCVDEDTFNVEVSFLGTGTYTITDHEGTELTGVVQGTVFLGPYPNGSYAINVSSEQVADCSSDIVGFKDCANLPDCSLSIDGDVVCLDDDFFLVEVELSGIGEYIIFDGINPAMGDLTAGVYQVGPIPSGPYTISVTDQNNPDCFQTVTGNRNCSIDIPCNIDVVADATCVAMTTTYTIDLFVGGSGTYTITGMGESITDFSGGTLQLGPYGDQEYEFIISDQTDEDCSRIVSGTKICDEDNPGGGGGGGGGEDECSISTSSEIIVLDATRFYVGVNIVAEGTWTIDDGVNSPITGQAQGFVLVGPIFNGDYEIILTSEDIEDCVTVINGTWEGDVALGSISDIIWSDDDKDGIQDEGEEGFGGVTVILFTADNTQLQTEVTDQDGSYTFDNLAPGQYYIVLDVPFGLNVSPQDVGSDETIDSDFDESGVSSLIDLTEGDTVTEVGGGLFESFTCEEFSANLSIVCNGDNYFIGMAIIGGNSPFQIDAGEYFEGTIATEDFPVPYIGPIAADQDVEIFIIDAAGCPQALLAVGDCENVGMELIEFNGRVEEEGNLLYWSTAMEEGTDYFTLLRSSDGEHYESIAEINAANFSNQLISYDYLDKDAPIGLSYYQLILTDFDGTETPTNIVALSRGQFNFGIVEVSPIPVVDYLNIDFLLPSAGEVELQVHDVLGRLLKLEKRSDEAGQFTWPINVQDLPAGTYLLSLSWEGEASTIKFVKN